MVLSLGSGKVWRTETVLCSSRMHYALSAGRVAAGRAVIGRA